jgi:glutamate synthase domain-containing protein 2
MVFLFYLISLLIYAALGALALVWQPAIIIMLVLAPVFAIGVYDTIQRQKAVLRNFPVLGHFRYLFESIRPEIYQYFIESERDGKPFDRQQRSIVYQRAKKALSTVPFGTQLDVYRPGYEWINHSMCARHPTGIEPRISIGGNRCERPYSASILNISAMSFGALSSAAIRALNGGAAIGGFAHNTGEGGLSPHHLAPGGDIIWQIGTGYFGCRSEDGRFDADLFEEKAQLDAVKMIELKLSQGAKPGHGGILPAAKITPEIAAIRHVPLGQDVLSPPSHSAFDTPIGLLRFVQTLRDRSGGKPVGIKLCIGDRSEFLGVCMAMRDTGIAPDYIAIDGGEGGTGAAPLEFSDSIGSPLMEGLVFAHNALNGFGVREQIRLIASGKITTGFDMASRLAAGADLCYAARGFMFALGCIQALRCNSNHCPVGVATQDPRLVRGLDVTHKTQRTANFHKQTVEAFMELLGAAGIATPELLRPWHIHRRISHTEVKTYEEIYQFLEPGALLEGEAPKEYRSWLARASADSFPCRAAQLVL